jgi:proteasome alpha subunit
MQLAAQKYRLTYEGPIDINSLAKHLSAYLHNYTIYAVRPQAASIIISGKDQTGIQLYQVDPSGTFFRGSGFAIGQYSELALEIIQRGYSADMNLDEAIRLSNQAVEKPLGNKPQIQTGVVSVQDGQFRRVTNN